MLYTPYPIHSNQEIAMPLKFVIKVKWHCVSVCTNKRQIKILIRPVPVLRCYTNLSIWGEKLSSLGILNVSLTRHRLCTE